MIRLLKVRDVNTRVAIIAGFGVVGLLLALLAVVGRVDDTVIQYFIAAVATVLLSVAFRTFRLGLPFFYLIFCWLPLLTALIFIPKKEVVATYPGAYSNVVRWEFEIQWLVAWFYFVSFALFSSHKKFWKTVHETFSRVVRRRTHGHLVPTVYAVSAILASFVFLPNWPTDLYNISGRNLLPGQAWNALSVVFLGMTMIFGSTRYYLSAIGIVAIWFLVHYARVDILGVLFLVIAVHLREARRWKQGMADVSTSRYILVVLMCLTILIIGEVRNRTGVTWLDALDNLVSAIFNNRSVQDVVHSLGASISALRTYGLETTFAVLPFKIIPGLGDGLEDAAYYVQRRIGTNYGMFLSGEFVLNFGLIAGGLVAPFLSYWLLFLPNRAMSSSNDDRKKALVYFVSYVTTPRTLWYGLIFFFKMLVVILPAVYLLHVMFSTIKNRSA